MLRTAALWLGLAIAFYVAFWVLVMMAGPHMRLSLSGLFSILWSGGLYYLPVFIVAMLPPAILHLFAPRRLALWSNLFLLISVALPAAWFLMIRADYLRQTARGTHVEGVGLWNVFAYVCMLGLYASVVSLTLALLQKTRLHVGTAAAIVILYIAMFLSGFAPFFAVLYH